MKIELQNGLPATDLGTAGWIKPWSGMNGGDCEIAAFVNGAKNGLAVNLIA